MKIPLRELKIDLEDHKKRLKELKNKKIAKDLDRKFSVKSFYLIPVYKRIIDNIEKEIIKRTKK
jgi:hypothetical protein